MDLATHIILQTPSVIQAHEDGYDANYEGMPLSNNPHEAGSPEHAAWECGHLQAQSVREEWERSNSERGRAFP